MEFRKIKFPELKQVKNTDEFCPIHHTKLVSFGDRTPFCVECQKEKINQEEKQRADQVKLRNHRRKTIQVLEKDSIVSDPLLWQSTFENYVPDGIESNEALRKAEVFASEYLKTLNTINTKKNEIKEMISKEGEFSDKTLLLKEELKAIERSTSFNTIFTGVPGVGKSHLAMSILKFVNSNADPIASCLFVSINNLLRIIKDSINNPKSKYTEQNMIRILSSADLLVIDDLGSESSFKREVRESSEFNQNVLFGVLDSRSRTIITTNLSSAELEEVYNPKIVSRIYRGVEGHVIKFTKATKDKRSKIQF